MMEDIGDERASVVGNESCRVPEIWISDNEWESKVEAALSGTPRVFIVDHGIRAIHSRSAARFRRIVGAIGMTRRRMRDRSWLRIR